MPLSQSPHHLSGRFRRITDRIDTRRLERETSRLLAAGLVVAIILHAGLFLIMPQRQPLPTSPIGIPMSFRITPPRSLQPFHVHAPDAEPVEPYRKPFSPGQPREFEGRRPDVLDTSFGEMPVFDIGDTTGMDIDYIMAFEDSFGIEIPRLPDAVAHYIRRKRSDEIFMQDELLRIDDFDTGDSRYQGLVIYNPTDPMSITGMITIPQLYDNSIPYPHNLTIRMINFPETMSFFTNIRVKIGKPFRFSDNTDIRAPFLYIGTGNLFEYTKYDIEGLRSYIDSGGFVMLENYKNGLWLSPAEASLKQFLKDTFGSRLRLIPLPNDHAIYHCYFHFDDGPPYARPEVNADGVMVIAPKYIEGIYIGGRMVGIFSNESWGGGGTGAYSRIMVNIVVYALRNAGLAERYADTSLPRGKLGSFADEYRELFSLYGKE